MVRLASGHSLGRVPPGPGERNIRKGWCGTGEAGPYSLVSKDRRYKPVVKADGVERESDGRSYLGGLPRLDDEGRAPTLVTPGNGRKRKGMDGNARPNYPHGHVPGAKV